MSQILGEGQSVSVVSPHGLDQIRATFGDIFACLHPDHTLDPQWQTDFLQRIMLPFPMTLSWDRTRSVSQVTCHKRLGNIFADVFGRVQSTGSEKQITSFGGCFSFRPQRTGTKLSTHSWGIAIDLNPETNAQGPQEIWTRPSSTFFAKPDFSGEATGKEDRAIQCIFSFVADIRRRSD